MTRRCLRGLVVAATVGTVLTPSAHGQGHAGMDDGPARGVAVRIGFSAFTPAHVDVLVGDTVRWTNVSVRDHTVTADDGAFDSGRLAPQDGFSWRPVAPGPAPYHCRLHPIPGTVAAHMLLLEDPGPAGGPGTRRVLHGRSVLPPGTEVTLESVADGSTSAQAGSVGDDGAVHFTVAPERTTTYRLVAGTEVSPARSVVVLDRRVRVSARPLRGRRTRVSGSVAPASPGATAVLQLRLPERFGWWPVARARVDRASRVGFTIPRGRRVRARVVLTLPDGAAVVATSNTVLVGGRGAAAAPSAQPLP